MRQIDEREQVRDAEAVRAACARLNLPLPVAGTTRLFSGSVIGLAVQLPGWSYPAVCQLETADLAGHRSSEGAFFMTKQFTFNQRGR